jgi:hypothetical protein
MRKSHSKIRKQELILAEHVPFEGAGKTHESFVNWGQYMNELFAQKVEEAHRGYHGDGMDIMGP